MIVSDNMMGCIDVIWFIRYCILAVITLAAVFDDYRRYRISNRIIIAGAIVGVVLGVAQVCAAVYIKQDAHEEIISICRMYISGMAVALIISMVVYKLKGIGAGDVKLLAVAGLYIGPRDVLWLIGVSLAAGVVIGVIETVRNKEIKMISGVKLHKFHFSYAIMSGVVIMVCAGIMGR